MPWPRTSDPPAPLTFSPREWWGLLLLLGVLFLWTLAPLAGFDFWYYLAVGREVAQTGQIPWAQSYLGTTSTLAFGRYADAAWLAYLLCYLVYASSGLLGLVLLKSFLLTATTGLVYLSSRLCGLSPFWAAAWSTLGLWTVRSRFEMRSYLFTDLALAVLVTLLIMAERDHNFRRTALGLAVLFVIWTNLHQGILAGFLIIGCWMLFGRMPWKQRVGLTVLAGACSMVKPHALAFPGFLYDHFANSSAIDGVVEWAAPEADAFLYHLGPLYLILLAVAVSAALRLWRQGSAPPWAFGIVALAFALLAARSIRSIAELLPVVCPLAAAYFPPMPGDRRLQGLAGLILAILLMTTFRSDDLRGLSQAQGYPTHLADAIPKNSGQVFNSFEFGNYLVFRNIPPFLHGITSLYTEQLITDFHDVLNPTPRRQAILRQFGVGSALLHLPTDNDATLNLVDTLAESPDWKLELWDDTGLLFLKGHRSEGLTQVRPWRSPSWVDAAAAERELTDLVKRRPSATAHRMLSQLLLERGEVAQATAQANQAVTISPYFSAAWSQLGLCYAKAGNLEGVLRASEGALRADGTHAAARYNRALALLEKSNRGQGLSSSWARWQAGYQARRALWLDPDFTPAQKLLEQL